MADVTGISVDIGNVIAKAQEADKAIETLAKNGKSNLLTLKSSFKDLTKDGVNHFIRRLDVALKRLDSIKDKSVFFKLDVDAAKATQQLSSVSTAATAAVDSMNKLISSLKNVSEVNKSRAITNNESMLSHSLLSGRKQEMAEYKRLSNEIQKANLAEMEVSRRLARVNRDAANAHKIAMEQKKLDTQKATNAIKLQSIQETKALATEVNFSKAMIMNESTYRSRIAKIERLNTLIAELSRNESANTGKINEAKNKISELNRENDAYIKNLGKFKKELSKVSGGMNDIGNLARKLRQVTATMFSIHAIYSFVNSIMKVRGEFELQHRSLQVLIQDMDEANKLWDKTVQLAVKSPFKVKELVSYTKQLAAYRIETEKLYETNKMLADVSAGLGVDMSRLILAFGQVKAASFLRGTELRQFSEAGIPMLDELSKRFSELEGKMVSVGEVFERISRRMVTFSDVEAVFKKITSEGGVFYQMQEKQSETVRGMQANLRDSLDLMINDIGESTDSIIKSMLTLAKDLIDNWRSVVPAIVAVTVATGTLSFSVSALNGAVSRLFTTISAHPITLVLAGVAAAIGYLATAASMTNKLNSELLKIEKTQTKLFEDNISLYKKYAEASNDVTKSTKEQSEAKSELKQRFQDILPDELLEIKNVSELSNKYAAAEEAMRAYYNAKADEQKKDKIIESYVESLNTDTYDLIESLKEFVGSRAYSLFGKGDVGKQKQKELKEAIGGIVTSVVSDVESGVLSSDTTDVMNEISNRMNKYVGINDLFGDLSLASGVSKNVDELVEAIIERNERLTAVEGLPFATLEDKEYAEWYNVNKERIKKIKDYFNQLANLYKEYSTKIDKIGSKEFERDLKLITNGYSSDSEIDFATKLLNNMSDTLKESAKKGEFGFTSDLSTIIMQSFTQGLSDIYTQGSSNAASEIGKKVFSKIGQELSSEAKNTGLKDFQKAILDVLKLVDKDNVLTDSLLASLIPDNKTSKSDIISRVEGILEDYQKTVSSYDTSIGAEVEEGVALKTLSVSKEQLANMRASIPVLDKLLAMLGKSKEVKTTDSDTDGASVVSKQIQVIKSLYDDYNKTAATLGKSKAITAALEKNRDAFASIFNRTDVETMSAEEFITNVLNFPDAQAIVDFLNDLKENVTDKADQIKIDLAKGDYVYEIEIKAKESSDKNLNDLVEKMFGDYELSLELDKLGIPPDLASQLFGIDSISLPELRANLEAKRGEFIGLEQEDKYKEWLKKLSELEDKHRLENLKKYSKYLVKAQSERVKIKLEELRQIEEIESLSDADDSTKMRMREGVREETQKKLSDLEWEEFKSSDMYIDIFNDLEHASNTALSAMITRLSKMKDSLKELDPSDLKEIVNAINKAKEALANKDPFKAIADNMKKAKQYRMDAEMLNMSYLNSYDEEARIRNEADDLAMSIKDREEEFAAETAYRKQQLEQGKELTEEEELYYNALQNILREERERLDLMLKQAVAQGKITAEIAKQIREGADAESAVANGLDTISDIFGSLSKNIDELKEGLEGFGDIGAFGDILSIGSTLSSGAQGITSSFKDFKTVGSIWNEDKDGNKSLNVGNLIGKVGGVMGIAGAAAQAVSSIINVGAAIHDARIEKEIQAEVELVDKLGKQYENLEERIDEAYSIDKLNRANTMAKNNLEAQIDSYRKMIKLEEDKKKTDDARIKEWQEKIADAQEQLRELEEKFYEELGGFGSDLSYKDAANEFVDAWFDAFKETGNGLTGLQDKWDEYFNNIIKKQMLMRGVQTIIEPTLRTLDSMLSDGIMTEDEWNNIQKMSDSTNEKLNEYLSKFADRYGVLMDSDEADLTGLQRGIQSITEETANALQALLNSIRFFVADNNTQLKIIAGSYNTEDTPNPMLAQLKVIAAQTTAIRNLLDSVTFVHPRGGRGFKVVI